MIPALGAQVGRALSSLSGVDNAKLLKDTSRLLIGVDKVPAKLPPLLLGETVSARVLERQPEGRMLALIKNGLFTLQLPPQLSAKGETLQLRVASLTPQLTFALAGEAKEGSANTSVAVRLSDATHYMNALLRAAPQAGASRAVPTLLADPQAAAGSRGEQLAQTVKDSGVFYEASQKAWVEGRLPLEKLQSQPQAQLGEQLKAQPAGRAEAAAELGALVARQLDTLETRTVNVQVNAWPGQPAQWQIEREADPEREADGSDEQQAWSTRLNLELPALGELGARLRLVGKQVQLSLAADAATLQLASEHRARLEEALAAAGLQLAALNLREAVPGDQAESQAQDGPAPAEGTP
ncbi:flagellar hook-length control protein FliK [Crenobacter caeni]|uniref:Flagellar hook-length control protein FliK n=1 Tax=Crenobacter caeni TaxID=2705474 RepID=A0A6B2KP01_9NEIS|nr:flagellar hook-length control protein FliK [Crenobacter caeni]NDV11966.1 flagellar hook-length control protein FliK [Crenobacter caeni]